MSGPLGELDNNQMMDSLWVKVGPLIPKNPMSDPRPGTEQKKDHEVENQKVKPRARYLILDLNFLIP